MIPVFTHNRLKEGYIKQLYLLLAFFTENDPKVTSVIELLVTRKQPVSYWIIIYLVYLKIINKLNFY